MLRLDTYSKLPWEKKPDGRYWTHITLGEANKELKYFYRDNGGALKERIEIPTDEGLFNDGSVKSLPGLPVLLSHPKKGLYSLNKEGTRIGTILSSVGREDGKLIAEVIIDDRRGVKVIDELLAAGRSPEASSGYNLRDLIPREDGKYEQIRGRYDHVAAPLLPGAGRAGSGVGLRFDSTDAFDEGTRIYFDLGGKKRVGDIVVRLDNSDLILDDQEGKVKRIVDYYTGRIDTLTSDLEGVEERLEELQKENEGLKGENEGLKVRADSATSQDEIDKEVQLRLDTWKEATEMVPDLEIDYSLGRPGIYKSAIAKIAPTLNTDSFSEEALLGVWKGLCLNRPASAKPSTDGFLADRARSDSNGKSKTAIAYEEAHKRRRR